MEIKKVCPEDFEQFCNVSAMAFIWKVDMSKESFPEKESIYGAFEGDTLMAQVELFGHEAFFCNRLLPAVGIGGVATMPEYRRKGAVRGLFEHTEALAEENGWVLGFLYPFSFNYYRQFGYELVMRTLELSVKTQYLSAFERNSNAEIYTGKNPDELHTIYNRIAANTNLMFCRTDDTYFIKEPYKTAEYTYIWRYNDGTPGAIVTYALDREQRTLNVKEIFFTDRQALAGVLGFLRCYDAQVDEYRFLKLQQHSPLLDMFGEHNKLGVSMKPGAAARIYDLEALLKANEYPDTHGHFTLLSRDTLARNSGAFEVEYEHGCAQVRRVKTDKYDIALTAPAAARLLLSGEAFNAGTVTYLDGVETNGEAADFFRAFPQRNTFLCDGF